MKFITPFIIAAGALVSTYGQDPAAFRIKGVALGVTEKAFIDSKVKAVVADSHGRDAGIVIYESSDENSPPKSVTFTFLDGVLIRIVAEYSKEELAQIGGTEIFKKKLIERLGRPSLSDTLTGVRRGDTLYLEDAFWDFENLGISFGMDSQIKNEVLSATLRAVDSKGWNEYKKRKEKNAKTGFSEG